MQRFAEQLEPYGNRPERMDGDAAFYGVDMMLAPDKMRAGWLSEGKNIIIVDGEVRNREGMVGQFWGYPSTASTIPINSRASFDAAAVYDTGDQVYHGGRIYEAQRDGVLPTPPATTSDWIWQVAISETIYRKYFSTTGVAHGAGMFKEADGTFWNVTIFTFGLQRYAYLVRQFADSRRIAFPAGYPTITENLVIVQALGKLLLFSPEGHQALVWDGDVLDENFVPLVTEEPDPGDGTTILPDGRAALYHRSRLWVVHGEDNVAIGNIGSLRYDASAFDEAINDGESGRVVKLYAYNRNTVLVFKDPKGIYRYEIGKADLSDLRLEQLTDEYGTPAPGSVAGWGSFCAFLDYDGVFLVNQVDETRMEVEPLPLSYPITPLIERINWGYAHQSQAVVHGGKYYLAVPLNDPEENEGATQLNAILVYDIQRGAWLGHWESSGNLEWDIQQFVKGYYNGRLRALWQAYGGWLMLMNEGDQDFYEDDNPVGLFEDVAGLARLRGYNGAAPERQSEVVLRLDLLQQDLNLTVVLHRPGVEENETLETSKSWDGNPLTVEGVVLDATNANEDFLTAGRGDYTVDLPAPDGGVYLHDGLQLDAMQSFELGWDVLGEGRFLQAELSWTRGRIRLAAARVAGARGMSNLSDKMSG
jgi:hypothetical protein